MAILISNNSNVLCNNKGMSAIMTIIILIYVSVKMTTIIIIQ